MKKVNWINVVIGTWFTLVVILCITLAAHAYLTV